MLKFYHKKSDLSRKNHKKSYFFLWIAILGLIK